MLSSSPLRLTFTLVLRDAWLPSVRIPGDVGKHRSPTPTNSPAKTVYSQAAAHILEWSIVFCLHMFLSNWRSEKKAPSQESRSAKDSSWCERPSDPRASEQLHLPPEHNQAWDLEQNRMLHCQQHNNTGSTGNLSLTVTSVLLHAICLLPLEIQGEYHTLRGSSFEADMLASATRLRLSSQSRTNVTERANEIAVCGAADSQRGSRRSPEVFQNSTWMMSLNGQSCQDCPATSRPSSTTNCFHRCSWLNNEMLSWLLHFKASGCLCFARGSCGEKQAALGEWWRADICCDPPGNLCSGRAEVSLYTPRTFWNTLPLGRGWSFQFAAGHIPGDIRDGSLRHQVIGSPSTWAKQHQGAWVFSLLAALTAGRRTGFSVSKAVCVGRAQISTLVIPWPDATSWRKLKWGHSSVSERSSHSMLQTGDSPLCAPERKHVKCLYNSVMFLHV